MSQKGIKLAADAFSYLQNVRHQLLEMSTKKLEKIKTNGCQQDIMLAQMLDDMKDVGKEKFCEITMMDVD